REHAQALELLRLEHLRLEPLPLLLAALALADVAVLADPAQRRTVGAAREHAPAVEDPLPVAVLAAQAVLADVQRRLAAQVALELGLDALAVLGMHESRPGVDVALDLTLLPAEHR